MIFRPDRHRRGHDPLLGQKMLIFALGAVLGVLGIALELDWLVYVALAVLLIGVIARIVTRRRDDEPSAD